MYFFLRLKIVLVFIFLLFLQIYNKVYANVDDIIKVGLKNYSKGEINNNSIIVSYSQDTNSKDTEKSEFIINTDSYFFITIDAKNYIKTENIYFVYEKAKEDLENYKKTGIKGVIAFFDDNHFEIYLENNDQNTENKKQRLLLKDDKDNILLFENNNIPIKIKDLNLKEINLSNKLYRGFIEIVLEKNIITFINVLNIDEYLYSVVASEMPSNWNIEALKAQAVASRSYTYFTKNLKLHKLYDICDDIHCQCYLGKNVESANSILAVESTKNIKAYYNNSIINATYFSSSGGSTENSEDVWTEELPYLRSINDNFEQESKIWTRTIYFKEIEKELIEKGIDIGKIIYINLEKTLNKRVNKLIIKGTKKDYEITKENVRTFFKFLKEGSLQSRNFDIIENNQVNNNLFIVDKDGIKKNKQSNLYIIKETGELVYIDEKNDSIDIKTQEDEIKYFYDNKNLNNDYIVLNGKGYGHGVGMSQYGAKNMADNFYKFDDILKFYFKNIEIK